MNGPTLADLRRKVQKDRHREIGNWLARRVARPAAVYGTWVAVRLGVSAHQVTLAALMVQCAAAASIGTGNRAGFVAGVALLHLAFWLDHVDGQVARWRGTAGLDGVYFDYLMHHVGAVTTGFALGFGLATRAADLNWTFAGFSAGVGWMFLGLNNDCRYKAFFQRLKRETRTYRIDGGSGGRPAPPAAWPRRGFAALRWPVYKACEPHVVLMALTGAAVLACFHGALWVAAWRIGLIGYALAAPLLAFGRAARTVSAGAVEREFAEWFREDA